jgi:uncharacterized protein
MNLIERNIDKIRELCELHRVRNLFAFGSVLTSKFTPSSDVDLVVDFQGVDLYEYAENYFNLKESLEELLQREVDLLEEKAIKNPYLRNTINSSRMVVYGQ